jgi:hypothetical protein
VSITRTNTSALRRYAPDHFEPQDDSDPAAQRKMRGQLEQIDYTAFASNREVIGHLLGQADAQKFQRLAVAAAQARASWVATALEMTAKGGPLTSADTRRLAELRAAYDELTEVYEAMRRMVERGYLGYRMANP